MRIVTAILAVAVTAGIVACSSADTTTGPGSVRAPAFGVNAASPNGAWVEKESGTCGMVGSGPNGEAIFGGFGVVATAVENNNKVMISCKGTGITNLSGRTQTYRDFPCGIIGVKDGTEYLTTDSHATVTKDGNATLTCTAQL